MCVCLGGTYIFVYTVKLKARGFFCFAFELYALLYSAFHEFVFVQCNVTCIFEKQTKQQQKKLLIQVP